jgi:hypothetical protein
MKAGCQNATLRYGRRRGAMSRMIAPVPRKGLKRERGEKALPSNPRLSLQL